MQQLDCGSLSCEKVSLLPSPSTTVSANSQAVTVIFWFQPLMSVVTNSPQLPFGMHPTWYRFAPDASWCLFHMYILHSYPGSFLIIVYKIRCWGVNYSLKCLNSLLSLKNVYLLCTLHIEFIIKVKHFLKIYIYFLKFANKLMWRQNCQISRLTQKQDTITCLSVEYLFLKFTKMKSSCYFQVSKHHCFNIHLWLWASFDGSLCDVLRWRWAQEAHKIL